MSSRTSYSAASSATIDPSSTTDPVAASGDVVIASFQKNTDTGTADSLIQNVNASIAVASLGADATDESSLAVDGNEIHSDAEINAVNNTIDVEHLGLGLHFAIAAYQDNDATADSLIDVVNLSIAVDGATYGDMSISNNDIASFARANLMNNQITSESGGEEGSIALALWQDNAGAVTSRTSNVNLSMSATTTTDTLYGDMSVANKTVSSNALGNAMTNQIAYDGNMVLASVSNNTIGAYQHNSGDLTASIYNVDMGIRVPGVTGSTVGVRNNTVSASAVANSASNIIRMR